MKVITDKLITIYCCDSELQKSTALPSIIEKELSNGYSLISHNKNDSLTCLIFGKYKIENKVITFNGHFKNQEDVNKKIVTMLDAEGLDGWELNYFEIKSNPNYATKCVDATLFLKRKILK